jgi:hypothetical protein
MLVFFIAGYSTTRHLSPVVAERLLTSMNADFEHLRNDRYEWESFKAETAAWDRVAGDLDRASPDPAPRP